MAKLILMKWVNVFYETGVSKAVCLFRMIQVLILKVLRGMGVTANESPTDRANDQIHDLA